MKILQIINSLNIGGAEMLLLEYTPLLQEKGFVVDILVLGKIDLDLRLHMKSRGVNIYSLEFSNIYNPIIIFYLIRYLRKYSLIHVHLFPAQYWVAMAKLISCSKTKLITTEHNTTNRRRKIRFFRYIDIFIYSFYCKIISISDTATDNLTLYLRSDLNIVTIYNGVNVSKFMNAPAAQRELLVNLDANKIIVTMVAGFRHQKDQITLIKSISLLSNSFHLVLIGDGIQRSKCEELVALLNLKDRVHFLGIRKDVPELLKMSDLIVLSSHFEGLSLSSVEGMSVGKPFIASDVDGLREVVEGAGLLFQEGNEVQLSNILYRLSIDRMLYNKIASLCLLRAKEYDISVMVSRYIDLYNLYKS